MAGAKGPDDDEAAKFAWARAYSPWRLFMDAMLLIGKQAAVLIFTYWMVCPFNPVNRQVLMACKEDVMGWWAYPCEGTKACVRSFPLLGASMAMIIAGRFILQRRMYYHLLARRALLDFAPYNFARDKVMIIIGLSFCVSCLHFVMDMCFPPYVTLDKLARIAVIYITPCCVFFVLFDSLCDVERHLVPLPKFYEEDPAWAKGHLHNSALYSETSIKKSADIALEDLRAATASGDGTYTLDDLLQRTLNAAEVHRGRMSAASYGTASLAENATRWRRAVTHDLSAGTVFKGLWPGRILLDGNLSDEASKEFRRVGKTFMILFMIVQVITLMVLGYNGLKEAMDTMPESVTRAQRLAIHELLELEGAYYEVFGDGYCRDEGMNRPDGYWKELDDMTPATALLHLRSRPVWHGHLRSDANDGIAVTPAFASAPAASLAMLAAVNAEQALLLPDPRITSSRALPCAAHCSRHKFCIGYAIDEDMCSVYLRKPRPAPPGWRSFTETPTTRQEAELPTGALFDISQGNGAPGAICLVKADLGGRPQDIIGCVVHLLHAFLVLAVLVLAASRTARGVSWDSLDHDKD